MTRTCDRCGSTIAESAPRYERSTSGAADDCFCSLNCLADTDRFDEDEVRDRLFGTVRIEA